MTSDTPLTCSICLDYITPEQLCTTNCNHIFCKQCLDTWFDRKRLSCPMCRGDIQYFNHNDISTRVVCIVKTVSPMIQRIPPRILGTTILITRRYLLCINSIMTVFFIATCAMGSLLGKCRGYY